MFNGSNGPKAQTLKLSFNSILEEGGAVEAVEFNCTAKKISTVR
jgi:hypothetical protein